MYPVRRAAFLNLEEAKPNDVVAFRGPKEVTVPQASIHHCQLDGPIQVARGYASSDGTIAAARH
jgi:hypothetical protein